jgi:nucleotide-binding universal stress UspA family protein
MEAINYNFDHILCPVDFSDSSTVALAHAAQLASKFNGKLTILHVRDSFSEYMVKHKFHSNGMDENVYLSRATTLLQEHADQIKKLKNIEVQLVVKKGKLASELETFAKEYNVSDVVIGMHGENGRDAYFKGSNACKIVSNLKVPVLQVDQHANGGGYSRIVVTLDSSFHAREKVPYATNLAKRFGAEIRLLVLHTSRDSEIRDHVTKVQYQVEKYIHDHGINFQTCVRNSENLADDTLEYADEVNADLIIIMSEQEKTLRGLFMGSYAQQLLSIATRPVLTIPPKVHMVMAGVSV